MDSEADDYELTGSEQEYDEDEREILEDLRKQRNKRKQDASAPQEILAFSDEDEEEDDNVADLMRDSDIEGADDDDAHLPNTMDWGTRRSTYYNTDFVDPDYSSYNAQEEEEAKAEEEEAKKIQLRLAKRFSEADFQLDDVPAAISDEEVDGDVAKSGIKVTADLTGLTGRERLQLLQKDSPEFLGLTQDFHLHLGEVQQLITPVLNYVRNHQVPMVPALEFASVYHNVLATYCSNVSYYLLLKARRSNVKLHPVIKRLVQLKQLREQLTSRYDTYIKPQLEALLERIQDGDAFTVLDVAQRKAKLQILNKFEQRNEKENGTATATAEDISGDSSDDEDAQLMPDQQDDDEDPEAEAVRRGITYQMAKNKGLTPHRKKELRNPRVKHRGKYRKALIRRKGAVRAVRKETQRYGGEMSGIKATVTKSVKFRT
ncbi:something about silencing protein 10 [Drosophila pseudoobscura]|uniref:Something about silencing protein 10 n=1 Tax=Drosophila pseudoobscura pseudoobscura TaxID=46245 RepID=A0A6I8UH57_DROPS|nr:something about silencing protein 10 [Drosophila pseudoobscura]